MSREPNLSLAVALGIAGLVSALLVICVPSVFHANLDFLFGAVFGAMLSVCLCFYKVVTPVLKLLVMTVVSSIALPVSALIGAYLELFSPWPLLPPGSPFSEASKIALFEGGAVGAFLLLTTFLLLFNSEQWATKTLFKALCWSLFGGASGVVGWNLRPWLGTALWSLQYDLNLTLPNDKLEDAVRQGRTGIDSLLIVWQTGMGLLLGVMLMPRNSMKEAGAPEYQVLTSR